MTFDREAFYGIMGRDAFVELAGVEVVRAEAGFAEVRLPVTAKVLNGHGKVHGGAIFTLADYAGAIASNLHGETTMAVNGAISFMRGVTSGHVTARARTVKSGKRMKFQVVEVFDAEERLVATFQGGSMHVPRRDGSGDEAAGPANCEA